jgi:hypothetical protein
MKTTLRNEAQPVLIGNECFTLTYGQCLQVSRALGLHITYALQHGELERAHKLRGQSIRFNRIIEEVFPDVRY